MDEYLMWLTENKQRLNTYSLNEIRDVAIAVGFDQSVVDQWVSREKFQGHV